MDCTPVTWPAWVAIAVFICTGYVAWRAHLLCAQIECIFDAIEDSIDEEEARTHE